MRCTVPNPQPTSRAIAIMPFRLLPQGEYPCSTIRGSSQTRNNGGKSRQVGTMPAEDLAKQLLRELVKEGKA